MQLNNYRGFCKGVTFPENASRRSLELSREFQIDPWKFSWNGFSTISWFLYSPVRDISFKKKRKRKRKKEEREFLRDFENSDSKPLGSTTWSFVSRGEKEGRKKLSYAALKFIKLGRDSENTSNNNNQVDAVFCVESGGWLVKFRCAFFALPPLISLNPSRVHSARKRGGAGWRAKHQEGFIMLVPVIIRLMDVN